MYKAMNEFEKSVITIIKASLNDETPILTTEIDYEKVYKFAVRQQIVNILFDGLSKIQDFHKSPIYPRFFASACEHMVVSVRQMSEIDRIKTVFNGAGIDFLLLKGALLKTLYPKPELRTMGDADILIKKEQEKEISIIMKKLGYIQHNGDEHEFVWDKPGQLHLELHKSLMPIKMLSYREYYNDSWKNAMKAVGNEYYFSKEDTLIFLVAHFSKHFGYSGAGIRNIIDFYLYLKKYPNLNQEYMMTEFKKLNIDEFYENIKLLVENWFYNKMSKDVTELMTDLLFEGGIYGSVQKRLESDSAKYSKNHLSYKISAFSKTVFKKPYQLEFYYPYLKKHKILLPFAWASHWLEVLLKRRNSMKVVAKNASSLSKDKGEKRIEELEKVGLHFN